MCSTIALFRARSPVDLTDPNNAIGGVPALGDRIFCYVEAVDLFGQRVTQRTTSALVVKTLYHDMDGDGRGWPSLLLNFGGL